MRQKYPKYRVSQWVDTSEASMSKENADIVYGVQAKLSKEGQWKHLANGTDPLFFDAADKASAYCDMLRKRDAAQNKAA